MALFQYLYPLFGQSPFNCLSQKYKMGSKGGDPSMLSDDINGQYSLDKLDFYSILCLRVICSDQISQTLSLHLDNFQNPLVFRLVLLNNYMEGSGNAIIK